MSILDDLLESATQDSSEDGEGTTYTTMQYFIKSMHALDESFGLARVFGQFEIARLHKLDSKIKYVCIYGGEGPDEIIEFVFDTTTVTLEELLPLICSLSFMFGGYPSESEKLKAEYDRFVAKGIYLGVSGGSTRLIPKDSIKNKCNEPGLLSHIDINNYNSV